MNTTTKTIKRLLLLLICLPLMFSCGEKKDDDKKHNKSHAISYDEKEDRNSLLWRIEKDDETSYLFGTNHIMCKDDMVYTDLLDDLVKEVDVIVTESDDADMSEPEYGKGMLGVDIPDDYKLAYMYSEYELRELFNYLTYLGYDEDVIDFLFNTDMISFVFYTIESCLPDCEMSGSEIYLESIIDKEEELYLEDTRDLKPIFSKWINYTYQNINSSMTGYSVEEFIEYHYEECSDESFLNEMVHYRNNDPKADWEEMMEFEDELEEVVVKGMVKYLLNERNRLWIPRMINIMDDDEALFAVGALHVLDLVERLEKKGYTLTPLDI